MQECISKITRIKVTPTEAQEQMQFVQWLRLKNIAHFRVPNETFTRSWKQKNMNKALGVSKGVPDLFICLPNKLIAIEMKRVKGSVTSLEQKQWIERLSKAGIPAIIAKGCAEAIAFTQLMLKSRQDS